MPKARSGEYSKSRLVKAECVSHKFIIRISATTYNVFSPRCPIRSCDKVLTIGGNK